MAAKIEIRGIVYVDGVEFRDNDIQLLQGLLSAEPAFTNGVSVIRNDGQAAASFYGPFAAVLALREVRNIRLREWLR
jgi:hypothetical protein